MMKEHKVQLLISSAVVVFPALFGLLVWNALPDAMAVHWGADGMVDGLGNKAFAVFGLPLILLPIHWICVAAMLPAQKHLGQNRKALRIMFWMVPLSSLIANGIIYATAFGRAVDVMMLVPALLGIMLIAIGNYLPKVKQNNVLGIKVLWTLQNEENWNKTHRLGGKVWVLCGLFLLFSICLPLDWMVPTMMIAILTTVIIPIGYSYSLYKKHQKEGIVYVAGPKGKWEKLVGGIVTAVTAVMLIAIAIVMFSGEIKVKNEDASFTIEASYWSDRTVAYADIEAVTYRDDVDLGVRTNGFGSARLLMGSFQNEEFGSYTLYAYVGSDAYIIITLPNETLVIGMKDRKEIQALYQAIVNKLEP